MSRLTRRAAVIAAVAAALASASAWAAPAKGWPAAPGDMSLGNPHAPVQVVEYLSLSCPHCAHFNETVFPAFKAKYVDTGRVYYTAREMLTAPAQVAAAGFLLARCNGGTNYFTILDQVFKSQPRWRDGEIKPIFLEIAQANGVSEAQFEACISDEKALADLESRVRSAAEKDKVTGTPTFFVNGVELPDDHAPTLAELDAAIAKAARSRRR